MGSARPKTWIELRAVGPAASRDIASAIFIEAGSPGVSEGFVEAARDVLVAVSPRAGDLPDGAEMAGSGGAGEAELTAYLPEDAGAELEGLSARLSPFGWSFAVSTYTDVDWSVKWRAEIRPVRVSARGRSVLVKPAWSRARPRSCEAVVLIDPGMAFGTGSHATTKLCLRAIIGLIVDRQPQDILDVGCGTGVLAIAAVKLGVAHAVGVEIDPVALDVARANARKNHVRLTLGPGPVERVRGRFGVVVANILSGELRRLAPVLSKKIRPDGSLVLSGIVDDKGTAGEVKDVVAVYEALGLRRVKTLTSSGWAALLLKKDPRAMT